VSASHPEDESLPSAVTHDVPETAAGGARPSRAAAFLSRLRSTSRLLGDPGRARATLEDDGVEASLYYNHTLGILADGGLEPDAVARNSGSGDLFIAVDLERFAGLRGTEAWFQGKSRYGRNVNPRVGALSEPFDDADGDNPGHVSQLWLQHSLLDRRVQVRAGYLDQQVILDRNAYANSEDRQFMSTFLDNNNATIPLTIGLGAVLFLQPADWAEIVIATADADADPFSPGFDTAFDDVTSLFGHLEVGVGTRIPSPRGFLPGKYRVGLVWDPRTKQRFEASADARYRTGDAGAYLSVEQLVYRERSRSPEGLGVFARFGYRDPAVNAISHFWSLGVQYEGLFPARGGDAMGIGMYAAHLSADLQDASTERLEREMGLEVYYRIEALPWLDVTPDFQFIADPGARRSVANAVIFGLRARVTF
jgi:porin